MRRSFLFSVVITLGLAAAAWFAWTSGDGSARAALVPIPRAQDSPPGAAPLLALDEAAALAAPASIARRAATETPTGATRVDPVGATLDVTVLDEKNGAPVPGVRVEVSIVERHDRYLESYFDMVFAHTDGLGRALVDVPAGEPLGVRVSNQGAGLRVRPLAEGAKQQVELRVPVAEVRVFHGRVVAASDGLPIGGAEIVLLRSGHWLPSSDDDEDVPLGEVVASTDGDGRFAFKETSLRPSQLAVRAPRHDLLVFSADEGHETPERARVLELLAFARLVVTIPDAHGEQVGVVLHAYSVRAEERCGELGLDGRCTFENVWPHTSIDVEILRSNGTLRRIPSAMTLEPGETREVTWTLGGTRVHGSVARAGEAPLSGAEVWLLEPFGPPGERRLLYRDDDELLVARAKLAATGTFEFLDVAVGTYWIGVPPTEFGAGEYSFAHLIQVPGDVPEIRVDLEVLPGAFLAGRVQTREGAPCDGANVYTATDPTGFRISERADREGGFRLGPMPPGTYELAARRRGGAPSRPVRASTGEQDVVLELRAAARVRGQVTDASTGRLERAQYGIYSADAYPMTGATMHGTFEKELEPGGYTLVATTQDGRVSRPLAFDLAEGQELAGLEARLETGGRLRIRSSVPASWARVRWNGSIVAETVAGPERLLVLTLPLGDVVIELHDGSQVLATTRATVVPDAVAEAVLGP